jgi:hypothetical protein
MPAVSQCAKGSCLQGHTEAPALDEQRVSALTLAPLPPPSRSSGTAPPTGTLALWANEGFRSVGDSGLDQSGFVGQDDCLDAVAEPELGEDVGDVRLDGGLGHEQGQRDLAVREPAGSASPWPRWVTAKAWIDRVRCGSTRSNERHESANACSRRTGTPVESPCSTYGSLRPSGSSTDFAASGSPTTTVSRTPTAASTHSR